jgi:uncharacterized membrane protein HdeD (DUF308 family)
MIYFIGIVFMLIGVSIASINVENSDLPEGTPVVFIGTLFVLIGYLFVSSHNISKALEKELFPPLKIELIF